MALGTSDITTTLVKDTLGASGPPNVLSTLCTHANINKFSKYKPVQGTWPQDASSYYGLNMYQDWTYIRPVNNYRLGDFRGYEHTEALTMPPVYYTGSTPTTLYPTGTPYSHNFSPVPVNNSASDVRINTANLGIDDWYLGIRITCAGGPWYKTGVQLNSTGNQAISISAELTNYLTPAYSNLPYDSNVVMEWALIISDTQKSSWSALAPSHWMYLPTGSYGGVTMVTSGNVTIANWLALDNLSMIFNGSGSPYQSSNVYCSKPEYPQFTKTNNAAWINSNVYDSGTLISNAALYASGMEIRVTCDAITTACTVSPVVAEGEDWTINETYTSGSLTGSASRSSSITVSSAGTDKTITIDQGATGSDQLTWSFRSVDLGPGDTGIDVVITRGATIVFSDSTGNYKGRDGYTKTYTVTINETGIAGETYTVTMSRH